MATISSLGSGSGLDLQSLLTGLMQAEQQPLVALQSKEASYQARISSLGTLKGVLSALQSAASSLAPTKGTAAAKYTSVSASIADSSIASATVTATSTAVSGTYSLEVSALAQAQRLASPASSAYTSASSVIGTGDLTIAFGTLTGEPPAGNFSADSQRTKTITIDSSNATLGGLRDAINAANIGATATIVTGTNATTGASEAHLVLTSGATGLSNVMKLKGSGTLTDFDYDPATNSGTMSQDAAQGGQAATNASFKLNGIAATSSTNSVTGVLDGVTISLLKTSAILTPATTTPTVTPATYTPTTLTVSKNTSSGLTTALNSFITAYNTANKSMADLGAYDATTKAAGALQGDSTLRTARNQIRNLVFGTSLEGTPAYQRLSDIGVSLAKDGTLSLDSVKLGAAVASDPTAVANLVASIGKTFSTAMEGIVGKSGVDNSGSIASAVDGAKRSITDITKRQEAITARLAIIQANYTKQFTALDTLIASMKQTSTYLTQQLASIASTGS